MTFMETFMMKENNGKSRTFLYYSVRNGLGPWHNAVEDLNQTLYEAPCDM